jgi:hypothetical protein
MRKKREWYVCMSNTTTTLIGTYSAATKAWGDMVEMEGLRDKRLEEHTLEKLIITYK